MLMCDIKKGRWGILILDAGVLIFGLAAKFLASAMIDYLPDCVFARVGILCPSCGATRCVRELFSGHWGEAFMLNPFWFCLSLYLAAVLVLLNLGYLAGQKQCLKLGKAMISTKAIVILGILYVLFGIGRTLLTFLI